MIHKPSALRFWGKDAMYNLLVWWLLS